MFKSQFQHMVGLKKKAKEVQNEEEEKLNDLGQSTINIEPKNFQEYLWKWTKCKR